MADGLIPGDLSQILSTFLPGNKFREITTLLKKGNLELLLDRKYSDWLNSQSYLKSCDGQYDNSRNKDKLAAIIEKVVQCVAEPTISDEGGLDKEEMMKYETQASTIIMICHILLSTLFEDDDQLITRSGVTVDPAFRKFVMKKVSCCLVVLCAAHMESKPWTSAASKTIAHELLFLICTNCRCSSMPELLSGCVEVESGASTKQEVIDNRQTLNRVFPSGLLRHILDYLRTYLLKDTWKKSPLACHVLVWCTMQVKHPYIGEHFAKLMSPLLLLIDDYEVENKELGFKCLKHVVDNTNSAELQWYGRADVLFEAAQRHVYTTDPSLVRVLHPCLLSILAVVEPSPKKHKFGRKTTKCDSVFQIILSSMEFESKIAMRRAYASHLKDFIEHMGITILRHFKRLLRVLVSYLEVSDYPDEEARLSILDSLNNTMLQAWPRIPNHSSTILKCLLKLLVDVTDSAAHLSIEAYQQLKSKTAECLLVLMRCCGKQVEDQLKELKSVGHKEVEDCVENILKASGSEKGVSVALENDIT
ncbi:TEL2-interacting protein 2 [Desmophyllum pertusum]|uniref:TEL2-interacting protein 2 n=1 Tax=Desmophyllum pertusum TaxID=174260 RepID=A0A9X0A5Z0_9CNID|nr:TEL2-interacting protein 2 [Desmophyllum pertusum]